MKKVILFLSCCLLTCLLVACQKEINSITDFSQFSDMTQETDRVEVEFDNNSGVPFYFTIDNQEAVDEVMTIIFSATFIDRGEENLFAGDNTSIKIIQGEKEYNLHVRVNKDGKRYYAFSTGDLQNKIIELARQAGAYNE